MKQATLQASLAGSAVQPRTPLVIRYHDDWYDMSGWRVAHPAGTHWIDGFRDADATEVIDAFHSDEGKAILARLPKAKAPPSNLPPEVTPLTRSFRALRQQLLDEGWWRRDARSEILALAPCLTLLVAGTTVARTAPLLATVLLGLASTSAGWLGHDYIHGRGRLCTWLRGFGGLINGHSSFWWSNKHNLHHACTNEIGVDEDIMSDPFFYLWAPDAAADSQNRRLQHLYTPFVYSILFALWRFNSLRALRNVKGLWKAEGAVIGLNCARQQYSSSSRRNTMRAHTRPMLRCACMLHNPLRSAPSSAFRMPVLAERACASTDLADGIRIPRCPPRSVDGSLSAAARGDRPRAPSWPDVGFDCHLDTPDRGDV